MYIHILCMHIHVYYIFIYIQLHICIQNIHSQGWHVYLYTDIYIHDCVMLCGLFPLGVAFWEFRVCFLKACVRVCVCTHVCGVVNCVCVCVCSYVGLCCFVCCKYVGIYVYIMVSWFLLFPPFQFCCRRV
jgi:hypothetical protein